MASDHFVWSDETPDGALVLGMVARRAYAIEGRELVARPHAAWAPTADDLLALFRETTDVILEGCAHSDKPVTRITTQLSVGPVTKRVEVIGDRQLVVAADGSLSETAPRPFTSMPLTYDRAYGGRDIGAEALVERDGIAQHGVLAYPRNRRGRGYLFDVDRKRHHGAPLPNLSDPDDPVVVSRLFATRVGDWIDRPTPACYAPIDGHTFPRLLHNGIGVFIARREHPIREAALGAITEADLTPDRAHRDVRACNAAAPGLAVARLEGHEHVSLWNLHREHAHLELRLPGERPRMLIEPPNTRTFELEPKLATVRIEPDENRIALVWAASMPVAGVYSPEMCADLRRAVTWN